MSKKELKVIRDDLNKLSKRIGKPGATGMSNIRVGAHGKGREAEWARQLMLPELKKTPVLVPSLTPSMMATGTGYSAASSVFGRVLNNADLADPFPLAGKKSSITIAFPTMVNSIYRTTGERATFVDANYSADFGPNTYQDVVNPAQPNAKFQTRMLLASPLGVAKAAIMPHIVEGEPRYYMTNFASPSRAYIRWEMRGGFSYVIKHVYTDGAETVTTQNVSNTSVFEITLLALKTLAYFTISYAPFSQGTLGAGGPTSPSVAIPGARPISRLTYVHSHLRYPDAPNAAEVSLFSTDGDPQTFAISSYSDLIPSKATRDVCGGLSLLTSNRSSALNRGGTIATAFVDSEALIVPDTDVYTSLIKRNNDAKETDGKLGSYTWWMPTNERHFATTDVDLLRSGIGQTSEQENFLISVVRPTDEGDDFKTFATYISCYKTSSRLHSVSCQPAYHLTPDLLCILHSVPSVTDNPDHRGIFGKIWNGVKNFTTQQIKNPENWKKLGTWFGALL